MPLVAGLALLVLLLVLVRGYVGADVKSLLKGFRFSGGVLLALLTVVLVATGRDAFAFIAASGAWALLFGSSPPWQRNPYGAGGTGGSGNRGGDSRAGGGRNAPATRNAMSREEALSVLGLKEGASVEDVRAAHRRLIVQTHPDKGGTNYLAAKINEAKDVLLRRG
jgi:hypothetical protein